MENLTLALFLGLNDLAITQCPAPLALCQWPFDTADAMGSPRITPKGWTNRAPYGTMMMLIETLVVRDIVSPTVHHPVELSRISTCQLWISEPLGMGVR